MAEQLERKTVSSGSQWEPVVGYSRAVRVGSLVFVSGTVAAGPDGEIVSPGDAYAQTAFILSKIETALREAGASMRDVVRTRMFVTDIGRWIDIGRAHREAFGGVRPAATMVEVSRLASAEALVEIEADAVIGADGRDGQRHGALV